MEYFSNGDCRQERVQSGGLVKGTMPKLACD